MFLVLEGKLRILNWAEAMAAPKPEEISHPAMDQLQGLEYCIDSNPSWGMFIFHHFSNPNLQFFVFCFLVGFFCFPNFGSHFLFLKTGEAIALGFQHYILALGTAVMIPSFLVPLMGGDDVSWFCIPSSLNSYLCGLCLKINAKATLSKVRLFMDFLPPHIFWHNVL